MKIHPQVISQQGQAVFVVLPYEEYQKLLAALEDVEDIEAIEAALNEDAERFPLALVERIAAGENAIKVFREYRRLTRAEVADKVGISRQYLAQLESGQRNGTLQSIKKIAQILQVNVEDIA